MRYFDRARFKTFFECVTPLIKGKNRATHSYK